MAKVWCDNCTDNNKMKIDTMRKENKNNASKQEFIWGDICCGKCGSIVATIEVESEGIYDFTKISEIKTQKNGG